MKCLKTFVNCIKLSLVYLQCATFNDVYKISSAGQCPKRCCLDFARYNKPTFYFSLLFWDSTFDKRVIAVLVHSYGNILLITVNRSME